MKKISVLLGIIFLTPIFCFGQSSDKTINILEKSYPSTRIKDQKGKFISTDERAVELVEIKVEDKSVKLGERFTAGNDWLKTLTVKMKNISNKPISRIVITLVFPEAKRGGGYAGSWIEYSAINGDTGELNEKKVAMPDKTVELIKDNYEEIKQRMKETGISVINQVIVAYVEVNFIDGGYWQSNRLFQSQ